MAQKFVIHDEYLILGNVELHADLVKGKDSSKTVGGGRWYYDKSKNTMYFWGKSIEFGQVTREEFDAAFKQPSVERAAIIFSYLEDFETVVKNSQENCNKTETESV
jgi:hypothetical protein